MMEKIRALQECVSKTSADRQISRDGPRASLRAVREISVHGSSRRPKTHQRLAKILENTEEFGTHDRPPSKPSKAGPTNKKR